MTAFIVAGNESQQWALAVDQVHRVMEVAQSDVEAMSRHEKDYIESIGRINGILVSILDLDALTEQAKAA